MGQSKAVHVIGHIRGAYSIGQQVRDFIVADDDHQGEEILDRGTQSLDRTHKEHPTVASRLQP